MSLTIETFDERLTDRYPKRIECSDGETHVVTPMVPSDWQSVERFLASIPDCERRFFRYDMSDSQRVEQWCAMLNYREVLPLLAWDGERIAADIALQLDPGQWTSHIGKLRLLVHPDYRSRGVGRALLREMVDVARCIGLHKLIHECAAPQMELITLLQETGFSEAARVPGFIRDHDGGIHDLVVMLH